MFHIYPGGDQKALAISESGLFTLILRCRDAVKPGTLPHRFRRWVTSEVLPTVRRTGRFEIADSAPSERRAMPEALSLRMVKEARQTFGARAAGQLWRELGLPMVPAMWFPPPQFDLFALTAQQAQPSVEMRG